MRRALSAFRPSGAKFHNKRVRGPTGLQYDSIAERDYHLLELYPLQAIREITGLELHPDVVLHAGVVWKLDFRFWEWIPARQWWQLVYVDVKGMKPRADAATLLNTRIKLWQADGPGVLRLIRRSGRRFTLWKQIDGGKYKREDGG